MKTVESTYNQTLEIKHSKFMAYLVPYSLFQETLMQLRTKHPKARHFVTAFRYINEFDQIVESSSDDGEPKGTSGRPTLAVIQGSELINIGIITIRYFGGTKLGTGGLVRAYSDATNGVISIAKLVEYEKTENYKIEFLYTNMGRVEYEISLLDINIENKEFYESSVIFDLKCREEIFRTLHKKVERLLISR